MERRGPDYFSLSEWYDGTKSFHGEHPQLYSSEDEDSASTHSSSSSFGSLQEIELAEDEGSLTRDQAEPILIPPVQNLSIHEEHEEHEEHDESGSEFEESNAMPAVPLTHIVSAPAAPARQASDSSQESACSSSHRKRGRGILRMFGIAHSKSAKESSKAQPLRTRYQDSRSPVAPRVVVKPLTQPRNASPSHNIRSSRKLEFPDSNTIRSPAEGITANATKVEQSRLGFAIPPNSRVEGTDAVVPCLGYSVRAGKPSRATATTASVNDLPPAYDVAVH